VLRIRDFHSVFLIWIRNFFHPGFGSRILHKKSVANYFDFFLLDQATTGIAVKLHTEFNVLSFSIPVFLKWINFKTSKFHYSKLNFSHVWIPISGIRKNFIIPDLDPISGSRTLEFKKRRILDPDPQRWICQSIS
jgi:hypothetical protein